MRSALASTLTRPPFAFKGTPRISVSFGSFACRVLILSNKLMSIVAEVDVVGPLPA